MQAETRVAIPEETLEVTRADGIRVIPVGVILADAIQAGAIPVTRAVGTRIAEIRAGGTPVAAIRVRVGTVTTRCRRGSAVSLGEPKDGRPRSIFQSDAVA